ncbi:putative nuclease HARBI1 isoform X1 [Eurosta solidaginis]|uniref:putative nuclease HARBI1 isoform X1 n=1 Tax=Eurosta solidaginis TaxID=178769 RepID=UPI003530C61A
MPRLSEKLKLKRLYKDILVNDLLMLEISDENGGNICAFGQMACVKTIFIAENKKRKEDEIWEDFTFAMVAFTEIRYGCDFVHHSVPKSHQFLQDVWPDLDERRFRTIARVSRSTFQVLYDLIKDDEIFNGPRSCKQFSLETQLLVVLYRLGSSGEGATISKIASLFGVSDGGAIQNMTNRIFQAILKVRQQFVYWPDSAERQSLVAETFDELPHCIGYVDGTEIKLAEKPLDDPEAYFFRKHVYSLKAQAVCDYKLRIRHLVLGFPGSVHDARIYNNCSLVTQASSLFTGAQWLAGDSAYKLTSTVITPYRSTSTEMTSHERNAFNRQFSQYRIRIEHCYGILKERFNSLKELRVTIRNDQSVKFACRWILVCAILHNIVIQQKDDNIDITDITEGDIGGEDEEGPETPNWSSSEGEAKRRAILTFMHASH